MFKVLRFDVKKFLICKNRLFIFQFLLTYFSFLMEKMFKRIPNFSESKEIAIVNLNIHCTYPKTNIIYLIITPITNGTKKIHTT